MKMMTKIAARLSLLALALVCAWAPAAHAEKKTTLGVFLPTTLTDGQQRFEFAEKLAAQLGTSLNQAVAAKSFGRYEDFAKAISDGTLDFASPAVQADIDLLRQATAPGAAGTANDDGDRPPAAATPAGRLVQALAARRSTGAGPIAVVPFNCTLSPLPPVPGPKQVAWGLVLTEVSAIVTGFSASTLPPAPTTRSPASGPFATASPAKANVRDRASAQTAASRIGVILGI